MSSSPALILDFSPETSAATRDWLVALLADHSVLAIHEDDITHPRRWVAHFSDDAARDRARAELDTLPDARGIRLEAVEIPDDDWATRTQADLPAVRIGRVTVAPPWDLPALPPTPDVLSAVPSVRTENILVVIEPSRGFGTGHHQSTRLCLTLLQGRELRGLAVSDVGTGSGVLAIAAAKLGAAQIEAIDADPDAVENARENIERNGVATVVRAHVQDLTEPPPPPADVVTANLTGALLAKHADTLTRFVRTGGVLIVSGFNVDEREMVADAFSPAFVISESAEEDDWWAFVLALRLPTQQSAPTAPRDPQRRRGA